MTSCNEEEALSLLFRQGGVKLEDIKFFVGNSETKTDEDIWAQVHSALMQERMGKAIVSTEFVDNAPLVNAVEFLTNL